MYFPMGQNGLDPAEVRRELQYATGLAMRPSRVLLSFGAGVLLYLGYDKYVRKGRRR